MNGPIGHFSACVIGGIALATSVIDTVLQRTRPTTIVHCRGGDSVPACVSEPEGWSFLATLTTLVQFGLVAFLCGYSAYAWYSADQVRELVPEISDIGPVVSTPSTRRRKP